MTFDFPTFNPNKLERRKKLGGLPSDALPGDEGRAESVARNRARRKVFDYVCGDDSLDLFCTLTLDKEKLARDEWGEIVRKLNVWLDNRVRRNGLKYVLVPEYHKDGHAIHFHGCMNSEALTLAASGHFDRGKEVFNITSWKYGFTTAKKIDSGVGSRVACAKYIAKYMTKGQEKIGGRYYLHGGSLAEPFFKYSNTDFDAADGFQMIAGNRAVKILSNL
jgi:hypothetical protein